MLADYSMGYCAAMLCPGQVFDAMNPGSSLKLNVFLEYRSGSLCVGPLK